MSTLTTLTIYQGLPASGKTSHALAAMLDRPLGSVVRANRDELRRMLLPRSYRTTPGEIEDMITMTQHIMIRDLLESGIDVLCDDTNLNPAFLPRLLSVAKCVDADVQWVILTGVGPRECVRRDACRPYSEQVGAKVIWDMWGRFIK